MNSGATGAGHTAPPVTTDDPSAASTWSYMQTVLDDALDAVHHARVRGEELTQTAERYKRAASELEERCQELEARCDEAHSSSAFTGSSLARLREEHEALQERYAQALLATLNFEETVKRARRMEERLRIVAEAVNRLDEKTDEIHTHYGNDLDTQPELTEEINFTRDETLEIIRRALAGLRARAHA